MYALALDHYSPLSLATYDPITGELYLEFDYDRLLDINGEWRDGRHIDAVTFMGQAYPIIIHDDNGPRDANGRYIFDRDTVDNIFTINVGTGHDPADGTLDFGLSDREDGTRQLYTFQLEETESTPPPVANEGPIAERDFASTSHNQTILVDVLANDSDPDGGALTVTNVVTESVSSIIVSIEDNKVKVNPLNAATNERIDTITYTVTDDQGASTQSVLIVDIAAKENGAVDPEQDAPNQAPVTVDDEVSINFDESILFDALANDSDPDGGALTLVDAFTETVVSIDVSVEDNQIRLDPVDVAVDRIDSITYTVMDEDGATSTGRLIVDISGESADASSPPVLVSAVNAGGDAFTAANGVTYQADRFDNGRLFSTVADIAGTTDDGLYQTEKWAKTLNYETEVANGTYDVELNFAEIWGGAQTAGKRVIDIFVEDELVFNDLDLADDAGFREALDIVGQVTVTDGSLSIRATGEVQNAKLAGFSIWEAEGAVGSDFTIGSLYDDLSF